MKFLTIDLAIFNVLYWNLIQFKYVCECKSFLLAARCDDGKWSNRCLPLIASQCDRRRRPPPTNTH